MKTNTCDKCNIKEDTTKLIWITAEDFKPLRGEVLPEKTYSQYDALCEGCYLQIVKNKITKKQALQVKFH
jgi:hypothetical protein